MDNRPIGMLDSGVGGLTVLREVIKNNKNENYIYYGDTKRFPYGSKSKDTIIELTKNGIEFLISKNVKTIIIACGTATSQALDEVKELYNIPIIGIINPTVEYIKQNKNLRRVGVIATAGTIRSKGWENHLKQNIKNVNIVSKACPLLAPMAEEGWIDNQIAKLTIRQYVKDLKDIDCLILGCTHYPLFKPLIEQELDKSVDIINTGEMVSKELEKILKQKNIKNSKDENGKYEIYLTDTESNFVNVAKKLLNNETIENEIQKANI